jgi:triosephosphate isomerase
MDKRKPLALSNWKMAMTVSESLDYLRELQVLSKGVIEDIDIIICPPYTALWAVAQAIGSSPIQLGAQNLAATTDIARTGQISAGLLAEVGCTWVMLGHWEVRRHLGDEDQSVNRKVHLAIDSGLKPILLVGEKSGDMRSRAETLGEQLQKILNGCPADQVAEMSVIYEPEATIGGDEPSQPEHVAAGCDLIRSWLHSHFGGSVSESVRIIYGGSVTPEYAPSLLTNPDIDGLGASRRGRDPHAFNQIIHQILSAKS